MTQPWRTTFVCAVALALAACSSVVSTDEAFSGGAGQSYVLVTDDDTTPPSKHIETFTFQRVDLASSTFLPERVPVGFHDISSSTFGKKNRFRTPATMAREHRFAGTTLPAGDYALVSTDNYSTNGTTSLTLVNCHSYGAAIYRFQEGAINIVPLGAAARRSRDVLLEQAAEVLKGYPGMTAPHVLAPKLGTATFEQGKKSGDADCNTSGRFSFAGSGAPQR